jgi:hypothetical protein
MRNILSEALAAEPPQYSDQSPVYSDQSPVYYKESPPPSPCSNRFPVVYTDDYETRYTTADPFAMPSLVPSLVPTLVQLSMEKIQVFCVSLSRVCQCMLAIS